MNFETSADSTVWITRKTLTPGFALTSLRISLVAGAWGTGNGAPGTAKYDNLKLLASSGGPSSITIPNSGFETPSLGFGNFQYGPTGGSWSFINGAGISAGSSGFTGGPFIPQGSQTAFIQTTGEFSQSLSGFQANTSYVVTFFAAQRTNCCNPGGQQFAVYLDGTLLGTFNPPLNGVYLEYSTAALITTTGSHTLKFVGLNPGGGDHTAFVDHVRITGSPVVGNGVQWLVSDHLGTPRMIIDQTAALANIKRHDYLPFGEEIFAGSAGRTAENGYAVGDGVRQQFTEKERDVETGLDYFGARYYASIQGRFTATDPLLSTGHPGAPQSWNRYSYTLNNPLRLIDPTGMFVIDPNLSTDDQDKIKAAYNNLKTSLKNYKVGSADYKRIQCALSKLGGIGVNNGVTVTVGNLSVTGLRILLRRRIRYLLPAFTLESRLGQIRCGQD